MNDSIFCLPNEERIIDRIEQLREYLDNLPDGMCASAAKKRAATAGKHSGAMVHLTRKRGMPHVEAARKENRP